MGPDYLFLAAGGVAALVAFFFLARGFRAGSRGSWCDAALGACFAAGLLAQGLAPNLKVERNSFVVPPAVGAHSTVTPRELVDRERQMKLLSVVLTGAATVGLLIRHRGLLTGAR